ncbi:MAG: nitrous oxide reductase accessory protein NosL [Gemmatimonadaceae bacterium]|nr:nitrous oxide reductase accessory protein NosL [Gemmatimonadaceae bacterium]
MRRTLSPISGVLLALSAVACSSGPRALVVGEDACRYCRMTIDDVRFGAMVITAKGRVETFDAVECLASFVSSLPPDSPPRSIWVANYEMPSEWLAASSAHYLHESTLRSPMGRELAAFDATTRPESLRAQYGGQMMTWDEVLAFVEREKFAPTGAGRMDSVAAPNRGAAPHRH